MKILTYNFFFFYSGLRVAQRSEAAPPSPVPKELPALPDSKVDSSNLDKSNAETEATIPEEEPKR